jgi:hypothetical protein
LCEPRLITSSQWLLFSSRFFALSLCLGASWKGVSYAEAKSLVPSSGPDHDSVEASPGLLCANRQFR